MKEPFLGCCVNLQAHQFRFLQRHKKIQTNTLNQLRFFALSFMHSLVYSSETLSIILCPHWKPRGYGDPLMSGFRVLEGRFAHPSSINCYITCRTCKTATFANIQKPALIWSTNWARHKAFNQQNTETVFISWNCLEVHMAENLHQSTQSYWQMGSESSDRNC